MRKNIQLVDATSGKVLVGSLFETENAWERGMGLLGRKGLEPDEGLLLRGCGSVHSFFMHFALDLVYLDRQQCVCKLVVQMPPWRFSAARGAVDVIELPAGRLQAGDINIGMEVAVMPRPVHPTTVDRETGLPVE